MPDFEATRFLEVHMKPIGPLMKEHRLIEKMLALMVEQREIITSGHQTDPAAVDLVVDFLKVYADRTHHGKEEEIYFRELEKKELVPELRRTMEDLTREHVYARKIVRSLTEANERFRGGDEAALEEMAAHLEALVDFYPLHIDKEDRRFFYPTQEYFSRPEQDDMLNEFAAFDARMIHEKYAGVVNSFAGA